MPPELYGPHDCIGDHVGLGPYGPQGRIEDCKRLVYCPIAGYICHQFLIVYLLSNGLCEGTTV